MDSDLSHLPVNLNQFEVFFQWTVDAEAFKVFLNILPLKAQDLWGSKKTPQMSILCSCQQIPGQFKCLSPILIKITGGPTPKTGPRSAIRGQLWPEPCGCMAYGYNLSLTRFRLNSGLGQPVNPLATHSLKLHINDCWGIESAKHNAMKCKYYHRHLCRDSALFILSFIPLFNFTQHSSNQ